MSFGSLLEYLKYFGPFLVKWDEYENDEKLLARFFLEVSSMSHTLFYESPFILIKGTGVTVLLSRTTIAFLHVFLKCIGSANKKYRSCLVSPTHGLYHFYQTQPQPHQSTTFVCMCFFLQTHPSSLPHDVFCLSGHPKALSLTRNILRTQAITHNNPKCTQINTYMDESW